MSKPSRAVRIVNVVRCELCYGEAERYAYATRCNLIVQTCRGREVCAGPLKIVRESRRELLARGKQAIRFKEHSTPVMICRSSRRAGGIGMY